VGLANSGATYLYVTLLFAALRLFRLSHVLHDRVSSRASSSRMKLNRVVVLRAAAQWQSFHVRGVPRIYLLQ
jgi:hypothetical protein